MWNFEVLPAIGQRARLLPNRRVGTGTRFQ